MSYEPKEFGCLHETNSHWMLCDSCAKAVDERIAALESEVRRLRECDTKDAQENAAREALIRSRRAISQAIISDDGLDGAEGVEVIIAIDAALSTPAPKSWGRVKKMEGRYQAWLEDYAQAFNSHARHHPSCKQGIPCECGLAQEQARLRYPCPANYDALRDLDADGGGA